MNSAFSRLVKSAAAAALSVCSIAARWATGAWSVSPSRRSSGADGVVEV